LCAERSGVTGVGGWLPRNEKKDVFDARVAGMGSEDGVRDGFSVIGVTGIAGLAFRVIFRANFLNGDIDLDIALPALLCDDFDAFNGEVRYPFFICEVEVVPDMLDPVSLAATS
jgi:hypothetical protein